MPHPKRRHSSTRRDKRRTHYKVDIPTVVTCSVTGEFHRPHHAYWVDNKMYYKGKVVLVKN